MSAKQPPHPSGRNRALNALAQKFAEANRLIFDKQFDRAMDMARRLRTLPGGQLGGQALFALAAALGGKGQQALAELEQLPPAEQIRPPEVLLATGSAWFSLQDIGRAMPYLAAAVKVAPRHPLAQARYGAALLATGQPEVALPHLEAAVQLMPQSGGASLNLARALLALERAEEALAELDRSIAATDRDPELYRMTRVEVLSLLGREDESERLLKEVAEQGNAPAAAGLVNLLAARGQHEEAARVLREALERHPEDIALMQLAADMSQVRGRFMEAARWMRRALDKQPENALLWARLAVLSQRRIGEKQGREAADKALALTEGLTGLPRAMALNADAHVWSEADDTARAEASYRAALEVMPGCVPAMSGLGHLLMQLGRVEEATALFEQVRSRAPLQGWSQLIHAREVPDDPKVLERMELAARRPTLEGPTQAHLLFTAASAWDKKGDYAKAWALATEANEAAKKHLPYRPEAHRRRAEREMARFSKAFMAARAGYGVDSRLPVFVLGMPRSGTTLVEQILGSHSQVFGAGELSQIPELIQKLNAWEVRLGTRRRYPECVDDMSASEVQRFASKMLAELQEFAPQAGRIVDKLPHNFEHVGLIKLLFPNAAILHLRREPRDVAMSNYFVDYSAKFGGMGFAYDLAWIGEQLVDHQRFMDHWHAVFPGQILEVDYDALVEDVEGWARRIIQHLHLDWEPGVLKFQELDRAVKTASVWQVRQPVYTTSKARWKRYESHLAPLEAALADVPPMPEPLPLPVLEPGLFLQGMDRLQEGQAAAAEPLFRQLVKSRPAHAAGHHFLGAALYSQGKLEEARKEMRRSLQLHRRHLQWLENLLLCEQALGNTEAVDKLREVIARRQSGRAAAAEEIPGVPAEAVEAVA